MICEIQMINDTDTSYKSMNKPYNVHIVKKPNQCSIKINEQNHIYTLSNVFFFWFSDGSTELKLPGTCKALHKDVVGKHQNMKFQQQTPLDTKSENEEEATKEIVPL